MKTDLFHLEILPVDRIVEHEVFDARRMEPILKRLQDEKKLVNPILVAPMDDGRYLQLDGMNRLSAFRKLNIPTIAAQIVDYADDKQVKLLSWMHLYRVPTEELIKQTDKKAPHPDPIRSEQKTHGRRLLLPGEGNNSLSLKERGGVRYMTPQYDSGWVATIITNGQSMHQVICSGSDNEKAKTILDLVRAYEPAGIIRENIPEQLSEKTLSHLFSVHHKAHGSVLFPTFTKQQIVSLVKDGGLLPAGITRHVVKNRCLNVNVSVDLMTSDTSVQEKNSQFDDFLSLRAVRRYEEPVVYIE